MAEERKGPEVIPFNDDVRKKLEEEQRIRRVQTVRREAQEKARHTASRTATVGQVADVGNKLLFCIEQVDAALMQAAVNSIMIRRGWIGRIIGPKITLDQVRKEIGTIHRLRDELVAEGRKEEKPVATPPKPMGSGPQ